MSVFKNASENDCYEIVSTKFKNEVSLEEQKTLMNKLNSIVRSFKGLKSRDYYYSTDNGRWVDFVIWESEEMAKLASQEVMQMQEALEVFSFMDEGSTIFSHYQRVGGLGDK